MIHSIKVKNYFSIGGEVNLNFEAKEGSITAPELYLDAPLGKKITKIAFVGGPNASGKTNILRAISFVKKIITEPLTAKDPTRLDYMRFLGNGSEEESSIEVCFSIDTKRIYDYKVVFTFRRILEEQLDITEKVEKRSSTTNVFKRKWENDKYIVSIANSIPNIKKIIGIGDLLDTENNRCNSFIAVTSNMDSINGILREVSIFWDNLVTNVSPLTTNDSVSMNAYKVLEKYKEGSPIKEKAKTLLKEMDIGYESFFEFKMPGEDSPSAYGIRHAYPKSGTFDILSPVESTGTQRLISIIDSIATALLVEKGGVAILDDMDAYIHPDLYEKLVNYFMSPSLNKNNAQLILCSHNYTTLNALDKQQIFLAERDDAGKTEAWRLDEVEGVQARDNFYARYMAGAYGAVPREDR